MKISLRRRVGRGSLAAALAALLSLSFAGVAAAADSPDQQVPTGTAVPPSGSYHDLRQMAQTFTAGKSGQLYRVSLYGQPYPFWMPAALTIQIWKVDRSQATLANLGGTPPTFQRTALYGWSPWHDFDLTPTVPVVAGTQYAVVVVSRPTSFRWGYLFWPYYAGGNLWLCCDLTSKWMATANTDFAFKTYVTTGTANTPPTVTVDHPTGMSFPENVTPTMTGTYSDSDGDTVTLKASAGTVTTATGGKWSWTGPQSDEGLQHVVMTADDGHGGLATAGFGYSVTDVTPTASISGYTTSAPIVLTVLESVTFNGSFSDPGSPDTHTATWDFGDGAAAVTTIPVGGSTTVSASHAYTNTGNFTVKLTVKDDDGTTSPAATFSVTVETTQQALAAIKAFVQKLSGLNDGQKNSLSAKLDNAAASALRGDTKAASNELNAFLNELDAYARAGRVTPGEATTLRAAVNAVKGSLGTFNRFLEWWPLGL